MANKVDRVSLPELQLKWSVVLYIQYRCQSGASALFVTHGLQPDQTYLTLQSLGVNLLMYVPMLV